MSLFRKSAGYRYLDAFVLANVIELATAEAPACPQCGAAMRMNKTRKDNRPFWGCTQYPACRGVRNLEEKNRQQAIAADRAKDAP